MKGSLREPLEGVAGGAAAIALAVLAADPKNVTRDIGSPVLEHMQYARRLLAAIPQPVRDAAADPFGARAVIYGLLLDTDKEVRMGQLKQLQFTADHAVYEATEKLLPFMLTLDEEARLPLMDFAMPSLLK